MKGILVILALSCAFALLRADSANIVILTSQGASNGISDHFLSAVGNVGKQISSVTLPDQTLQQKSTLNITNIQMVSFGVVTPSSNYTLNSSNSSVVVVVNSTFTASLKFLFSNNGSTQAAGYGTATITASNSSYSIFFGTSKGKPFHSIENLAYTWGSFSVSTNFSSNSSDPVNQNITSALNASVATLVNSKLTDAVRLTVNTNYSVSDGAWVPEVSYEYTLRRSFNWNNTYNLSVLNGSDFTTTATVNGSIEETGYTDTADTTTLNTTRTGKPNQIALSLKGFQNFVKYAFDNGYFVWNFDRSIFPLNTFDYSVGDLSYIVPSIATQASAGAFVELTCAPAAALATTFNPASNQVNLNVQTNCGVNVIGTTTNILNITFTTVLGIAPSVESTGTLNFVIASSTYTAGTATAIGQTLSAAQKSILEYNINGALTQLPGTYCAFGSGILLPTRSLSNLDYRFDNNWLYLSYY